MFRKNQPEITVVSTVAGMIDDKLIAPTLAQKAYPSWWKNMPKDLPWGDSKFRIRGTAKKCPSFVAWQSKGIIISAWCDMTLKYNSETNEWNWTAGRNSSHSVDVHPKDQFLDYADYFYKGLNAEYVFKLICPWQIITPKGWSVLQLPLFYHTEQEWTVLPGIIDTDVHHQIHQQVVYFGKGKEIFIAKGTPLVHYMPYKRTKTTLEVREATPSDNKKLASASHRIETEFRHGYKNLDR